ncbi:MAG TPA: DNA-3-methyladenine glycosylase I [Pseudogracilibacillus sp.]|nr:DNA-3-methyladenine glycosylase I [Pseudogracilibacillus sp.]
MNKTRCHWVTDDPLYIRYHDEEWGRFDSFFDDRYLFEMLTLEGAQAGLSWLTILKRRAHYRRAFCQFDLEGVAQFTEADIERLMTDEGIIRNRRKILSTITNSKAILQIQAEFGSFHSFLWDFFEHKRRINHWQTADEVPTHTPASQALSKALKKRGFSFVGPVICYSFMQAVGLVDDHLPTCFVRQEDRSST